MKKLFPVLLILLSLTACRYEEGPEFTIRTAKHRMVNTWYTGSIHTGGSVLTSYYQNYKLHIYKDNTYTLTYLIGGVTDYKETGKWAFTSAKLSIKFMPDSAANDSSSTWRITYLTERALNMYTYIDGDYTEMQLED